MASSMHADSDTMLRRRGAARALSEAGYPVSEATLATKASRGGGPPYQKFGRVPLYRRGDLFAWAEARLSAPMRSASKVDMAL